MYECEEPVFYHSVTTKRTAQRVTSHELIQDCQGHEVTRGGRSQGVGVHGVTRSGGHKGWEVIRSPGVMGGRSQGVGLGVTRGGRSWGHQGWAVTRGGRSGVHQGWEVIGLPGVGGYKGLGMIFIISLSLFSCPHYIHRVIIVHYLYNLLHVITVTFNYILSHCTQLLRSNCI